MQELKKFRVKCYTETQYYMEGKPQTYRGEKVTSRSEFNVTIYRENISHAIFTLFEQHHRTNRFGEEVMISMLDLESLQIVEV